MGFRVMGFGVWVMGCCGLGLWALGSCMERAETLDRYSLLAVYRSGAQQFFKLRLARRSGSFRFVRSGPLC